MGDQSDPPLPKQKHAVQPVDSESCADDDNSSNGDHGHLRHDDQSESIVVDLPKESQAPTRPNDDTVVRHRKPFGDAAPVSSIRDLKNAKQLEGQVLQHYTLDQMIGYGGMGVVFRASDIRLNRTVAVKVLTYREGKNEEIIRRFQQEAQSAAQLAHENIAQVYDVGEAEGWNFIAFEYVDGPNIRDMVSNEGPLRVDMAIGFVMQTAEALNHANDRDIVHRDVKPSNLIVTQDGQVKLVDMGLARLRDVDSGEQDLTESGMTLGTFDYISPEQAKDPRAADIRSDLYSLGCSLFFMLTGQTPFPPGTAAQKLMNHANEAPPDPRVFRDDIPNSLANVLFTMLAKDPDERYQDPLELIGALQTVADNECIEIYRTAIAPALTMRPPTPSFLTRQIPWIVPLGIFFATLLAIGGFPWEAQSNGVIPKFILPPIAFNEKTPEEVEPLPDTNHSDLVDLDALPADMTPAPERPIIADDLQTRPPRPTASNLTHGPISNNIVSSELNDIRRVIVLDPSNTGRSISPPRDTVSVNSLDEALMFLSSTNLREIELRTSTLELTKPLKLDGRHLTIVAGEDFSPIIRLRPVNSTETDSETDQKPDSLYSNGTIFNLVGGSLRLKRVALVLGAAGPFTGPSPIEVENVFRMTAAAQVELEDCWIRSEYSTSSDRPPALFDIVAPQEITLGIERPYIRITDCVIHGDISIARADIATPFDLDWSNGFLASSAKFLALHGAGSPLAVDEVVSVHLDHITAAIDQGLIGFEASVAAPELIGIDLECTNCIFIGSPRHPLIEQIAYHISVDRLDDFFRFRGRRNFYENTNVFWRKIVRDQNDLEQEELRSLSFSEWRDYWRLDESSSRWNVVQWQHRFAEGAPSHLLRPTDFALRRRPGNPARPIGGTEQTTAGMELDDLPQMPFLTTSP